MATSQILSLYKENKTPQYSEIIEYYRQLDSASRFTKLIEYGPTDSGEPLHLLVIDADMEFDVAKIRARKKSILMINNGIHPGEPDGIDACLRLMTELVNSDSLREQLSNIVIIMIPVYNIDGAMYRNSTSRVNQDGPESFGFRGNAQNYDLNRDFIKCNSLNARSFTEIFREWDPDVFVDTHVSNGADYQYVMTLIPTQHNKLMAPLGDYLKNTMLPELYEKMAADSFPMCPYVNEIERIPDDGIAGFLDLGRYSTGYTAMFNTLGFMPETHMLKPYPQRVESTYALLKVYIDYVHRHSNEILSVRAEAKAITKNANTFSINWQLDTAQYEEFMFSGYTAKYKMSEVSGLERLYYDRNAPFQKNIAFYDNYNTTISVKAPKAYIIPAAWKEVIERLKWNKIEMSQISEDTIMELEMYYIDGFKNTDHPFEGHYLHSNIQVHTEIQKIQLHKGDYIVYLNQDANYYIVQTLEPQAPDSFFAWGFFDAIMQQKEWFSDYVFEDVAAELLKEDPSLRKQLEDAIANDPSMKTDTNAQLAFVFQHSKYRELSYQRYPVGRLYNH